MAESELATVAQLSARIGADITLVQGAGGNTSIKLGNVLWVKASGTRLGDALHGNIFTPVDLDAVRAAVAAGSAELRPLGPDASPAPLRPSIETSLHAVLPQQVVVHVHSVNAIAWAVQADAPAKLRERLEGLAWIWLPYCRPGLPLAQAVATLVAERAPDVILLGNHGLVVAAADCAAAEVLMAEVERRLALPARLLPGPRLGDLAELAADTPFAPATPGECHDAALSPFHVEVAMAGSLYPDHVVFLGPGARALSRDETPRRMVQAAEAAGVPLPAFLLVPGVGTLIRRGLGSDAVSMLRCLGLVLARLPTQAPITYLAPAEERMLLDWEAEKYRKSRADMGGEASA